MPAISFQEAILAARDAFIEAFLAKVPSYTGASRAQLDTLRIDTTGFRITFALPHFLYNERHNANAVGFNLQQPGPYNAIPAATAAAEEVIRDEYERQLRVLMGRVAWQKK